MSKATRVTADTPPQMPLGNAGDDSERLRQEVARRAYLRHCDRGCAPGFDVDDWLAAEHEVLAERGGETPSEDRQ